MSSSFDPYYTWLGIPPEEQPPNHYRLLGLKDFEVNTEAISNAANRQMLLLRTFHSGPHVVFSQELLNQIAAARICLLNAEEKAAYDAQLRRGLDASQADSDHPPSTGTVRVSAGAVPDVEPPCFDNRPDTPDRPRRGEWLLDRLVSVGWKGQLALGTAVVASVLLVGVVFILSTPPREAELPPQAPASDTAAESKPRQVPSDVRPPVLVPIVDRTIQIGQPLQLTVAVEDPGAEGGGLTFRLEGPVPEGMRIDRTTGQINWQPGAEQLPGEYQVIVTVTGSVAGSPKARQSFVVRLHAAPEPPEPDLTRTADGSSQPTMPDKPMPDKTLPDKPATEPIRPKPVEKTIASEEKPSPQPAAQRHPEPDKSARAESLLAVKARFKKAYSSAKPHVRLALAAQFITESRQLQDAPTERYVLLDEARNLATHEGDLILGMIAADELARHFELDAVTLKAEVVHSSISKANTPAALVPTIEAAFTLAREGIATDAFGEVESLLRVVVTAARETGGTTLGKSVLARQKVVQHARQMYEESRPAAATLAEDPLDAKANLTLGRFYCLVAEDWEAGLAMLAQGNDEVLKGLALKLVADSSDTVAQLELADTWWKMAAELRGANLEKALLLNAARHWYGQTATRLTGEELTRARARLGAVGLQQPGTAQQPYRLSMSGLAGLYGLLPEKVTGEVAPGGGFANFLGKGTIEYPQIPAVSYIHEFELTFVKPQGLLTLRYGGSYRGAKTIMAWTSGQALVRCRVHNYVGGTVYWLGEQHFRAGEKVRFMFYVNENSYVLYQNDVRGRSTSTRPVDLRLIIASGANTAVNMSHCAFRPWTEADAKTRNCSIPPSRIEGNLAETALEWHGRNIDLGDRPLTAGPEPFVVGTTGTPMQWAAAGTFQRVYRGAKPPKSPTEVKITRGFWIGRYEITQAEWARLMPLATSRVTGSPFLPVDGVRWEDAANFCSLLTAREKKERRLPKGYQYRLPTEAEWEYACRAGSNEDFCTDKIDFWSKERSNWQPHEVGTSSANRWGIFDMHGNVAEWCCEMWHDLPVNPPPRLVDPFHPPSADTSLLCWRGGNWWQSQAGSSCSARDSDRSGDAGHTGFRIVLGPAPRPN